MHFGIEASLAQSANGRTTSNEVMKEKLRQWFLK